MSDLLPAYLKSYGELVFTCAATGKPLCIPQGSPFLATLDVIKRQWERTPAACLKARSMLRAMFYRTVETAASARTNDIARLLAE